MNVNTYLFFDGKAKMAIAEYERVLGAKTLYVFTNGQAPGCEELSEELKDRIMHAQVALANHVLMVSDAPSERYSKPQGFFVSLSVSTPDEVERIFSELSFEGKVIMPVEETFFAKSFTMFSDRFGTPWMVICEKEM